MAKIGFAIAATALLLLSTPQVIHAQGKTCVYNCTPPPSGGGGGTYYAPPAPAPRVNANRREAQRLNDLGIAASFRYEWQTAINYYEQALRFDPNDAIIRRNLRQSRGGRALYLAREAVHRGDYLAAQPLLRQACELFPEDKSGNTCREYRDNEVILISARGNTEFNSGRFNNAIAFYNQALKHRPNDPVIMDNVKRAREKLAESRSKQKPKQVTCLSVEATFNQYAHDLKGCDGINRESQPYRDCINAALAKYNACK